MSEGAKVFLIEDSKLPKGEMCIYCAHFDACIFANQCAANSKTCYFSPHRFRPVEIVVRECEWEYQNDEGYYETKCCQSFYFLDDLRSSDETTFPENFKWCPYCGKMIKPVYPPEEEDE